MTTRISVSGILENLNTVIEVDKVFPKENSPKVSTADLKTIGIQLNKNQALQLAAYLSLAVSDGWDVIDITGYREPKRNNLYRLTITTTR